MLEPSSTVDNEATIGNASISKLRIPGIGITFSDNGPNLIDGYVLTYNSSTGEVNLQRRRWNRSCNSNDILNNYKEI